MLQGRSAGGEIWRPRRSSVRWALEWRSGRRDPTARLRVSLWKRCGGQGGLKHTDGVESRWRRCLPAARSWVKFGACGSESRRAGLGKTLDVGAVLLRGLAGAPVRRDGVAAAAQRSGATERGEGGGARVRGGGCGWEEEGRLGLLFVGRRVALACGSGTGARRGSRPEIAAGRYARAEGAGGGRRSWRVGQGCQGQRAHA